MRPEGLAFFFPLLQNGFMIETEVGTSIRDFLLRPPGIDPAYIDKRIKTVFLDGKAVDDMETAFLDDGSTLALSAAMPGLAGATLRMGGSLVSFRSQITFRAKNKPGSRHKGLIFIRLYNLILRDLGVIFLKNGVLLKPVDLAEFMKGLSEEFWTNVKAASLNGQPQDLKKLSQMDWSGLRGLVELKIDFDT